MHEQLVFENFKTTRVMAKLLYTFQKLCDLYFKTWGHNLKIGVQGAH